ncbi:MAG: ABC transporter substrate-binding protein [Halodesulfovibrio sp.]
MLRKSISLVLFVLFVVLSCAATAFAEDRKKVLVIESYHADYAWDVSLLQGIRRGLGKDVEIFTFQMNTKRLPREQFQARAEAAFAYYREVKPDLVMLSDDNAAQLLGRRLVAEGIPIVYLGINGNPRNYGLSNSSNVLGVLERPLVQRSIMLLSELSSEIKQVLILFDDSTTSYEIARTMLNGETEFTLYGIECELVGVTFFENWKQVVLESGKNGFDAILLGTYHTLLGQNGTVVNEDIVMQWINEHTPVPLFALWDFSIGKGKAAAGFMLRGEDQGYAAAMLARSFFNGTQATAKLLTIEPSLVFSHYELERWKLNPDLKRQRKIVWVD